MAKYERISDDLREKIRSGALKPGAQLSAETTLASEYAVSLPTLRQAMSVLRAEGLIESRHGQGTFVRAPRRKIRRTAERYQWEKDRVRISDAKRAETGATEKDTGYVFDDLRFYASYEVVDADQSIAEDFGVPIGTKMLERVYRTQSRHEDAPISLVRSYLVHSIVAENPDLLDDSNEPWPGGTQHQLSTIGIELDSITDEITARPPLTEEAELLGLDKSGVSVLVLKKISSDTTGRVVEVSHVILPGDRTEFVYTTKLSRWEA